MGLRNWLHNRRMSDPVAGVLRLSGCSGAPSGAKYGTCRMFGVVSGSGVGPVAVEHRCAAPTARWPRPDQSLPVTVDRADPTRIRVRWQETRTNRERALRVAEREATRSLTIRDSTASAGTPESVRLPAEAQELIDRLTATARAAGAEVTTSMGFDLGDPGRPRPGTPGGGLTSDQAAARHDVKGDALHPATARVIAVHEVRFPPGSPAFTCATAGIVDLTLEVTPPWGDDYTTVLRMGFSSPDRRARIATCGTRLPVLINVAARDQIAVDTNQLT